MNKVNLGKVLVVDDEFDLVELAKEFLMEEGFEVASTTDSLTALELVSSFKPDIVLSDINMPKMNGLELLSEIRKNHKDLPVVLITGFIDTAMRAKADSLNVFGVINKPYKISSVLEMTSKGINRLK